MNFIFKKNKDSPFRHQQTVAAMLRCRFHHRRRHRRLRHAITGPGGTGSPSALRPPKNGLQITGLARGGRWGPRYPVHFAPYGSGPGGFEEFDTVPKMRRDLISTLGFHIPIPSMQKRYIYFHDLS